MIFIEQVNDFSERSVETSVIQLVHSVSGRVRIRVIWLQEYPLLIERVKTTIPSLPWVKDFQLNTNTNSITIHYDDEKISLEQFCQEVFKLIFQITPASYKEEEKDGATYFNSVPPLENKLMEMGGRVVGSSVGKIMGVGLGSITGGILLGPLGLIAGGGVGSVVGHVVGGQVVTDMVRGPEQVNSLKENSNDLRSKLQNTLERGGSEIISEAIGGVVGGVFGSLALGIPGFVVGKIIGGAIGSQVSEDIWLHSTKKKS